MEIRSLTPAEVRLGRPVGSLGKIRAVHHLVAQLFAKQVKTADIAKIVNRTPATVRNWINSPANEELVAQYEREFDATVTNQIDHRIEVKLRGITIAEEMRTEILEEAWAKGERFSLRELGAIIADGDDRTGIAKTTIQANLNLDAATKLEKARAARLRVIDGQTGKITKFVRRF